MRYERALRFFLAFIMGFILATLLHFAANAHSWYDPACCGMQDCHPIDSCDELHELPNGDYTWNGMTFEKGNVKSSHDNHCHVCVHDFHDGVPRGLCVYILQGS